MAPASAIQYRLGMRRNIKDQVEKDKERHQEKKMVNPEATLVPKRSMNSNCDMVKSMPYSPQTAVQAKAATTAASLQSWVDLSALTAGNPQGRITAAAMDAELGIGMPANRADHNLFFRVNQLG